MDIQPAAIEARTSERSEPVYAIAIWGVAGFLLIIGQALWRLTPLAVESLRDYSLSPVQLALFVLWVGFMAYSEGYKGFQRQFAPRLAVRAMYLARNPRPLLALLAPFMCMGLVHATRKRLIISWCLIIGIVGLIIAVRQLSQPWRGLVDGGVVVGLAWGTLAVLWYFAQALLGNPPNVPPDTPPGVSPDAQPDSATSAEGRHS